MSSHTNYYSFGRAHHCVRRKPKCQAPQQTQQTICCYDSVNSLLSYDVAPKKGGKESGVSSGKSDRYSFSSDGTIRRRNSEQSLCRPKHTPRHKHDHFDEFYFSFTSSSDASTKRNKVAHYKGKVFDMNVKNRSSGRPVMTKTVNKHFKGTYDPIDLLISNCKKTKQVVRDFQRAVDTRGWKVQVLEPERVELSCIKRSRHGSHHSGYDWVRYKDGVQETFLENISKYTSNTGWCHRSVRFPMKLILGLCHYSYDWSDRDFLICKIRADINWDYKVITIASPGLMSREGGIFGNEDLGLKGIRNFFHWNPYSRVYTTNRLPKHTKIYYQPVEETITLLSS